MNWEPPQRPVVHAENALLTGILDHTFPIGSTLPGERQLALDLGVTRPTLREALRRLERDGWLTIQQGKSTLVNDYWREGNMNVLTTLVAHASSLPAGFVGHLLEVRRDLAPGYGAAAVRRAGATTAQLLDDAPTVEEGPEAFASFDWRLHRALAELSGNPVYILILNGFASFYERLARLYFAAPEARAASAHFYTDLRAAAVHGDHVAAAATLNKTMDESLARWRAATAGQEELEI